MRVNPSRGGASGRWHGFCSPWLRNPCHRESSPPVRPMGARPPLPPHQSKAQLGSGGGSKKKPRTGPDSNSGGMLRLRRPLSAGRRGATGREDMCVSPSRGNFDMELHGWLPRPRRPQGAAAGDLGLRRLRRDRHHAADRRRAAVRDHRPPRRRTRARRRRRQRQRHPRRRPPLLRRDLHRLRPRARSSAAASAPPPSGQRDHLPGRGRRGAELPRRELRRRALDLRGDVHRRPRPGRRRDAAGLPAGRHHRHGELDARGLHRPGVQDPRPPPAAAAGRALAGALGHRARRSRRCSAPAPPRSSCVPQSFTFRYRSPEHFVELFRDLYGPVHKAFEALGDRGPAFEADLLALIAAHQPRDRRHAGGALGLCRGRHPQGLSAGRPAPRGAPSASSMTSPFR